MDHHPYELTLSDRNSMQRSDAPNMTIHNELMSPSVHFMNDMMFNTLSMPSTAPEMYTSAPSQCQTIESNTTNQNNNMNMSQHPQPYTPNTSTTANSLLASEDDSRLVEDIMSAFDTNSIINEPLYASPLYTQPPPSYLVRQTQPSHVDQISMSHSQHNVQQLPMQSMMARQDIPVVSPQTHPALYIPQIHDPTLSNSQLSPMSTQPSKNKSLLNVASTYLSSLQESTHPTHTNSAIMISMSEPMSMSESMATHHTENSYLSANSTANTLLRMDPCDFSSDHSSSSIQPITSSSSTSGLQSTLYQAKSFHSNKSLSDEEVMDDENDDSQKKKERRRQQVRFASRRRRKKQKDEESSLRVRIEELKEQIRIIGGDLSEQCSQMAGMNEEALKDAHDKQLVTVQNLRKDNEKLKEQLVQHENFARMIQHGLNSLPSDCRDDDQRKKSIGSSCWSGEQLLGNPLRGPTLVVDLNICHEAVREAYDEMKRFGPSVNAKTSVCYAIGWKTEIWASGTSLNFHAVRSITNKNISDVARESWKIMTSPEKSKRIYPDVKQFRVRCILSIREFSKSLTFVVYEQVLQKVTDDIVVVHRIASVGSDMTDREFISVAFQFRDGNEYYLGIKSIEVQAPCTENCIRGEECQGWKFTGSKDNATQWKAHFLGYYDVKGEEDDKILNQVANETMFGMLRWESEAMEPLSV